MLNVRVGDIAFCSKGTLGLITEPKPQQLAWGEAYVGIHLTDVLTAVGSPWSSRTPKVVGHINECGLTTQVNNCTVRLELTPDGTKLDFMVNHV